MARSFSLAFWILSRSTTFTNVALTPWALSMSSAASASSVGTSPQVAITRSASASESAVLAHFHSATPSASSALASLTVRNAGAGCLPQKMAFTQLVDW